MAPHPSRDRQQLDEHRQGVPDRVYATLGIVHPARWDLNDPVACLLGPVEDLDVEAEAMRLKWRKDPLSDLCGEGLEAALRVVHSAEHEDANQSVEYFAHRFPVPGLMQLDL
jgi:hypothetical protein